MGLQKLFLRIHPRSKTVKGGYRVQNYVIYGILFQEAAGWYKCEFAPEQWDTLRNVRNKSGDPDSKPVFDICTEAEKCKIEERERQAKITEVTRSAETAVDLTTADLREADTKETVQEVKRARVEAVVSETPVAPASVAIAKKRGRPRKVVTTTTDG